MRVMLNRPKHTDHGSWYCRNFYGSEACFLVLSKIIMKLLTKESLNRFAKLGSQEKYETIAWQL
jgi:hypothetical protein